ncbi:MAG: hypothetical protein M1368_09910, partial [Thaumarchaeota archaeon]|nr:hypothetical protein [Nitrososphaerota archaeon]
MAYWELFLKKSVLNGRGYYALAESYYEDGKTKTRYIRRLGSSPKLKLRGGGRYSRRLQTRSQSTFSTSKTWHATKESTPLPPATLYLSASVSSRVPEKP